METTTFLPHIRSHQMKSNPRQNAHPHSTSFLSTFALAAVLTLAGSGAAHAVDKSWNSANGNWTTAGNWSPIGVPGSTGVVRIGNLPGVQNSTVNAANAPFIPDSIEISDGMTLDTAGTEFVGFDLLVTIDG